MREKSGVGSRESGETAIIPSGKNLSVSRIPSLAPTPDSRPPTLFLRYPRLTILLCSLLWALCYPPFPLSFLAFAVLAPAFLASTALTRRQAFSAWFLAGLAYNTVMYWWIYNVMKVGPALIIGSGLVLMIVALSLFNGALGWAFRAAWESPRRRILLALYPLAWAGVEAARAVGDMSFPWNNLGYALGNWPALFQSVSIWGVYGLSALLVAANLLLFASLREAQSGSPRRALPAALLFAAVPLTLWAHGSLVLARADDSKAPFLTLSLVQPSIPQTKKWDEGYFADVMSKTFRTLKGRAGDYGPVRGSDLIVLAETAVPDFLRSRSAIADTLRAASAATGAPILAGALDFVSDRTPWSEYRFYNSAFLFHSGKREPEQYSKLRLVPFSEKLPFDGFFPVLNYVNLGEGDFSPGDGHRVWRGEAQKGSIPWSPSICYEVIYPSFAREARASGALLLVNITNDGWFGRSNGPYQHANIARFRAAENGMPLARAANNGVSVFYDAWGRDLGRTALMDSTVLRRTLRVPALDRFYTRAGGVVDGIFLALPLLWLLLWLPISDKVRVRDGKAG
jgi:apolipoprotein N-acyltransferase